MTLLHEIKKEYKFKHSKYSNPNFSKIISKAYSKLKRGKEIKWEEVKSHSANFGIPNLLNEILIELPTIKMVYDAIEIKLSEIDNTSEMEIQMIYGEYGQGKSQLGHLIVEKFSSSYSFPRLICLYYNVTTFPDFIDTLINCISLFFDQKPEYTKLEPYLDKLKNFKTKKKFSLREIIKNIIDILKEISKRGYRILLIFDELSKTLTHPDDFKFWADFFIELNDADNLKLLLVFLIPNSTGQEIRKIDRRFERWNFFFDMDAIHLTGKYLDKTPSAISNILAMKSIKSNNKFDDIAFQFFTGIVFHQYDYLENESIRLVNTFAVQLAEFYDKMVKWKLKPEIMAFQTKSPTIKGQIIEKKIRIFLEKAQLSDFQSIDKETDEIKIFRAKYNKKNLFHEQKKSDGHFILEKIDNKVITEESKIAVEMKFATQGNHTPEQLEKIKILAKAYPTLLISIGSSPVLCNNYISDMKEWNAANISSYPIRIFHIPDILYFPLLVLNDTEKTLLVNKIQVLNAWAKIFCKFFEEIQIFMKEIPSLLIERNYQMKIHSLGGGDTGGGTGATPPPIDDNDKNSFKKTISVICGFIDTKINRYKGYNVLKRDLLSEIKKKYPHAKDTFENNLDNYIAELKKNTQIELFSGKDGKRKIKKTPDWDSQQSLKILLEKKKEWNL